MGSKSEELQEIDSLLRTHMITLLKVGDTDGLKGLTSIIQYLRANHMIDKVQKDDQAEEVRERIRLANERRNRR